MDSRYRKGIGLMLINPNCLVFVGERFDTPGAWQMPQGGIDEGETPYQAALREMEEEIGTRDVVLRAESKNWYKYELPEELVPKFWGGKYIGQQQKWFVFSIKDETKININTSTPEFRRWQWIEPAHLPEIIVPFKRDMYIHLTEEFKQYTSS